MVLVAGLGNPGAGYENTRHNLGFRVVERIAARRGVRFGSGRVRAEVAKTSLQGVSVVLVKPQTYMNLSGEAVGPLCRWYRVEPGDVLVVCDDLDLPEGRIRVRRGGGAGGHKGLRSVIEALGTDQVPRLRIGIGRPAVGDAESFVLAAMGPETAERLAAAVERAADAVETWAREGIETCMNRFNADDEA